MMTPDSTRKKQPPSPHRPAGRFTLRSGLLHLSMVELLVALILLFLISPLVVELNHGDFIESALVTLVLVASVMAVGARRRTRLLAIFMVVPAMAARWTNHLRPDVIPDGATLLASLIFMLFVVVHMIDFILRAPRVNMEVLCAGIAGYLLLGLIWAYAFMIIGGQSPDAFIFSNTRDANPAMDQSSASYFSFMTLTTTGYGDITPVSNMARMLAVMESVTGTFYVTVLIARLVAMYSRQTGRPDESGSDTP